MGSNGAVGVTKVYRRSGEEASWHWGEGINIDVEAQVLQDVALPLEIHYLLNVWQCVDGFGFSAILMAWNPLMPLPSSNRFSEYYRCALRIALLHLRLASSCSRLYSAGANYVLPLLVAADRDCLRLVISGVHQISLLAHGLDNGI